MQTIIKRSYGVIPIFKNEDGFFVLLVKNSKGGHWGMPKGTPEKEEKPKDTAIRELFEETGIRDIDIKDTLVFTEQYNWEQNGNNYSKTNTYYPGFVNEMIKGDELDEIDELKWAKIKEAPNTLTYQSAIDVIAELEAWLSSSD